MELNKVSLEQWQDIENLIQLVETYGLTQEVSFQIIGRIPHVSKGYRDETDLYKDCEKLVSIVKDREPKVLKADPRMVNISGNALQEVM